VAPVIGALKIYEAQLAKDNPNVAQSLYNLADLYESMGQYAKAEPLYPSPEESSVSTWTAGPASGGGGLASPAAGSPRESRLA
jgi:Tetratricopeptide repeat